MQRAELEKKQGKQQETSLSLRGWRKGEGILSLEERAEVGQIADFGGKKKKIEVLYLNGKKSVITVGNLVTGKENAHCIQGASWGTNHERCKTGIMKKSAMTESKDSEYCGNQSLWDVEIAVRIGN